MAAKIETEYTRTIPYAGNAVEAFHYCANLESHLTTNFPGLVSFLEEDDMTYRWVFEKIEYSSYKFQIKLLTKFSFSGTNRIEAVSVKDPETSDIKATWEFRDSGERSELRFTAKLGVELPIPFLLKGVAGPILQKEMAKLFDRYLANVAKALWK